MNNDVQSFLKVYNAIAAVMENDYYEYVGVIDKNNITKPGETHIHDAYLKAESADVSDCPEILELFKDVKVYQVPGGGITGDSFTGSMFFDIDDTTYFVVNYYT